MKKLGLFFALLLAFSSLAQNNIEVQYLGNEPLNDALFLGKDVFASSYLVKDQVILIKRAESEKEFQNLSLGPITTVDAINPMQLSVFYKRFNTVLLLDKELVLIKTIALTERHPQLQPGYVSMSSQNRLWLWDELTNQLGLLAVQSLVYTSLTTPFPEPIKYRHSDVNYFYWISEENLLYYSDIYGKISKPYPLPAFEDIQIISPHKVIYRNDNQLYYLNLQTDVQQQLPIGEKSISGFFFNTQILSIFTDLEIKNYLITLP
ncbi:hypothetical protein [Flavobacterium sp. HSC-61S13]|uniref:hypothetical protein n=1 Tax=Flavobacterium sp. HSC-61S13 TaxID=2910963 RepID=UPI0020A10C07|nr:hypothetical protein [Flavobacterium sp. HSC-61S13]MCP1996917.1 hypothetical protein [Flavobacterium sp. HSC-61S13]